MEVGGWGTGGGARGRGMMSASLTLTVVAHSGRVSCGPGATFEQRWWQVQCVEREDEGHSGTDPRAGLLTELGEGGVGLDWRRPAAIYCRTAAFYCRTGIGRQKFPGGCSKNPPQSEIFGKRGAGRKAHLNAREIILTVTADKQRTGRCMGLSILGWNCISRDSQLSQRAPFGSTKWPWVSSSSKCWCL